MKKLFSVLTITLLFSVMGNYSFAVGLYEIWSGTYPAGAPTAPTYTSLADALTACNTIQGGISAKSVLIKADDPTVAAGTLTYDKTSPKWTSLLITSDSFGPWTLTCATDAPIITFNNAIEVTIDGSAGGSGLTFSSIVPGALNKGSINLSNGSSDNLIRNITCKSDDNNGRMINIAQTTVAGKGNNDNIVEFVTTDRGARGLQNFGTAGVASNDRNTFRNNKITNAAALGIFLGSVVNGMDCDNNQVFFTNPALVLGASFVGIQIQSAGLVNIRKNRIYDFHVPVGAATAHRGMISLPADFGGLPIPTTTTVNIINNFVSLSPVNPTGIVLGIQTQFSAAVTSIGYTANVMNNTAFIGGTTAATTAALTEAILGNRVVPAGTQTYFHNLSNNIAINKREGGTITSFHVGLDIEPTPTPGLTVKSDYNMCWAANVSNPTRSFAASYDFVYQNVDLAFYKFATANVPPVPIEQHTMFKDVPLVAGTTIGALDPALIGGDMCGEPKPLVIDDIKNDPRNALYPYKGCWEGPALKVLSVTVCLEGKVVGGEIKVSLYNAACVLIADGTAYIDFATGKTNLCFGNKVADGVGYYLEVNSINHLATWSANPNITFAAGGPPNAAYDFTTSASQAFGSNQTPGPPSCMFGGDVNQDGTIDVTDLGLIDNDAFAFVGGRRLPTDINSDLTVDISDAAIADNNAFSFVSEVSPCPAPTSIIPGQTEAKKLQTPDKSNTVLFEAQQ